MVFQPGQSGNPAGKPKGSLSVVSALKKELARIPDGEKKTQLKLLVEKIIEKGVKDGDVQMLKDIVNRIDGLPRETIDIQSKGERIGGFNFIRPKDDNSNDKATS